jgi:hypothetical protein
MSIIIEVLYELLIESGTRVTALIYEDKQFHRRRWIGSLVYGTIWILVTSVLLFGTIWLMRYLLDFEWPIWLLVVVGLGLTYWTGRHAKQWLQMYLWVMHHQDVPENTILFGNQQKRTNNKKH